MGGRIYHTPGLNPAKYPVYLKYMRELFQEHPEYKIVEAHNGALGVYALHAAKPMAKQLQEYAKKNDLKIIGAGDYKTFYDEGFIDLTP